MDKQSFEDAKGIDVTLPNWQVTWQEILANSEMISDPNDLEQGSFDVQNELALAAASDNEVKSTAHTIGHSADKRKHEATRNERIALRTSQGASAGILSRADFNEIYNYVSDEMDNLSSQVDANNQTITGLNGQLDVANNQLSSAEALVAEENQDVVEAEATLDRREEGIEGAKQTFKSAEEDYESAVDNDAADAAARGMMYASSRQANMERMAKEAEADVAEETAEYEAAVDYKQTLTEHINSLEERIEKLEGENAELQAELEQYKEFQEYLDSDDVQAKLDNGTLTMEELEANGMPEAMRTQFENRGVTAEAPKVQETSQREVTSAAPNDIGNNQSLNTPFQAAASGIETNPNTTPDNAMSTPAINAGVQAAAPVPT